MARERFNYFDIFLKEEAHTEETTRQGKIQ